MWELRKSEPDYETLILLANYFDVSIDYLLGREEPQQKKPTSIMKSELDITLSVDNKVATQYKDLWGEKTFCDTVKLYNGVSLEYRTLIFGCVLGALQALNVDTKRILGY